MAKISELYRSIYEQLKNLQNELDAAIRYDASEVQADEALRKRRIENLKEQLEKMDDYAAKAEYFRLMSEKNLTSKNILTITPRELNFTRLRNWAMMMDPTQTDDPYAKRIYVQSCCNLMFLENKKAEFTKALEELENRTDHLERDAGKKAAMEEEKRRLTERIRAVLEGGEAAELASLLALSQRQEEEETGLYSREPEEEQMIRLGICARPLPIPEEIRYVAREVFRDAYDQKTSSLFIPVEYSDGNENVLWVACAAAKAKKLYLGIQRYLLKLIGSRPLGTRKVYVLDGLHYNNSVLGYLRPLEGTVVLEPVPRSSEQILDTLKTLVSEFADIDEEIGLSDSVREYNASVKQEEQIARKVMVLIGYPRAFSAEAKNYIERILLNHERYGVTMVLMDTQYVPKKEQEQENVLMGDEGIRITMLPRQELVSAGQGVKRHFKWYLQQEELSKEYVDAISKYEAKNGLMGTEYLKRVNLSELPCYERGKKNVCVPYGVDGKDQVHTISFDNENFASYLMGASGSGKSTLLHTIITGILANYHPDDVELWLADFKMSEFAQYMDPLPPHVKYILLDESQELVYDLIDRLTDKMMERQRFFMNHRDMKKVENVPSDVYMPVIFVILDEFSIMSQAVERSESYKLKLQNILAKGRALGIKFIFASQEFTKGVAGLTSTAKEQIQMRLAMKNSYQEIDLTLELSSATKTDQVRNWMDALPPHVVLMKYRADDRMQVKRLSAMYFAGKGSEAYEPQRRLICRIQDSMEAVELSAYDANQPLAYVDKHPVIVDGNHYDGFSMEHLRKEFSDYRSAHGDEVTEEDVLLAVGTPRRMMRFLPIILSQESRENLLLISRASERGPAASIVMSIAKEFADQGGNVQIWAYARDRLYKFYKDTQLRPYHCVEGMDDICDSIRRMKDRIEAKESGNDLIILLGMDQICGDFEFYPSKPSGGRSGFRPKAVKVDLSEQMAVTEEEKQEVKEIMDVFLAFEPIAEAIEDECLEAGMSIEEIEKEIEKAREKFLTEQKAQSGTGAASGTDEKAETLDDEPEDAVETQKELFHAVEEEWEEEPHGAYNGAEDFKSIVSMGSRQGYHFLMVLGDYADLKQTKLGINLFRHRMAFALSPEDSQMMFGTTRAASGLPEHICQYTNRMESFSFRPFIHEGIGWDGWDVDENGVSYNTYE